MCCIAAQILNFNDVTLWGCNGAHTAENQLLDASFAYRFASISGFRNFLAHDYEKVDKEIICGQIINSLEDVDEFLRQICAVLDLDG